MKTTKNNNIISLGFTPEKIYKNDYIHYNQIIQFALETDFNVNEWDLNENSIIGESFIILKHTEKPITISFVLTGADTLGYTYECIYSDFRK